MSKINDAIIKVVGIGEFGVKAINYMLEKRMTGVGFISASYEDERMTPKAPPVDHSNHIRLSQSSSAEISQQALASISTAIANADLIFVIVDCEEVLEKHLLPVMETLTENKEMLSIGLITQPPAFKTGAANAHIGPLHYGLDTAIVISDLVTPACLDSNVNSRAISNASLALLHTAITSIADPINSDCIYSAIDFFDIACAFSQKGLAMIGYAKAQGTGRAALATEKAIESASIPESSLSMSDAALISIRASSCFKMEELYAAINTFKPCTLDDSLIFAAVMIDASMHNDLSVTIITTGFASAEYSQQQKSRYRLFSDAVEKKCTFK